MLSAVIRLPCVRPYEVKHHLLNEGLSHCNCLHRDREWRREEGGKSDEEVGRRREWETKGLFSFRVQHTLTESQWYQSCEAAA